MRRFLTIFIIVLCVGSTKAHSIWISPDGYCQYAVIDFSDSDLSKLKLTDKHRPSLDFISSLLNQYQDKITSQQYQIWIESYVGDQQTDSKANRDIARKLSNVIKSHFIVNNGLVEDNFKTHNYSGTFDGYSKVTIIAIGMRYPVEEIVTKQRLFHAQENDDPQISDSVLFGPVDYREVISEMNVDTTSILTPNFKVLYFDGHLSQVENSSEEKEIEQSNKTLSNDHGVLVDQNFHSQGLAQFVAPAPKADHLETMSDLTHRQGDNILVASVVAALDVTPGAVTTIVRIAPATRAITPTDYRPAHISRAQKAIHKKEINRKIDAQLCQQKEQQQQEKFFAKQQIDREKQISRAERKGGSNANTDIFTEAQVVGSLATGAEDDSFLSFDKIQTVDRVVGSGVGDLSIGRVEKSSQPSMIDQDPQPRPFGPVSDYGVKKELLPVTAPINRKTKNQPPLDGKSLEQSLNMAITAEQKVAERTERTQKEKAIREIIQANKAERLRETRIAKGRFAVAGVGVNLLSTAALTPSLQFDAYFSNRFSVAAEWYYSKWNFNPANVFNLSMGSLELRYFCLGKKKAFDGFYVGLYGGVGEYDFRWGTQDGRQSQFFSFGLSLGYVLPLGKSGFFFEAGVSGGYVSERIEKYLNYDAGYVRLNEQFRNSTIFAPTKIKLSIIYRIFNQKGE